MFWFEAAALFAASLLVSIFLATEPGPRRPGHNRQPAIVASYALTALLLVGMPVVASLMVRIDFVLIRPRLEQLRNAGVHDHDAHPLEGGFYFVVRTKGFSPDPYCGYEYVPEGGEVITDPHGSGDGEAVPIDGGWWWLCAS